jgi:hypothetical protein
MVHLQNLGQLVGLLDGLDCEFARFCFRAARTIVLRVAEARERMPEILSRHKIAKYFSLNHNQAHKQDK